MAILRRPRPKIRIATYVDLHLAIETIVQDEIVRHADAMRLHRVSGTIVVVSDLICDLKANGEDQVRIEARINVSVSHEAEIANSQFELENSGLLATQPESLGVHVLS